MILFSIANLGFYGRRWYRLHPILSIFMSILVFLLVVLLVLFARLYFVVEDSKNDMHETIRKAQIVREEKQRLDAANQPTVQLSHFESSGVVSTLNQVAQQTGVSIDEVSYVLDELVDQPYRRYQISFSTSSRYPLLRKMIQTLQSKNLHLSLDSISCARDDIVVADLHCSLTLSAYFKRD